MKWVIAIRDATLVVTVGMAAMFALFGPLLIWGPHWYTLTHVGVFMVVGFVSMFVED